MDLHHGKKTIIMKYISVRTSKRGELIDITQDISSEVRSSGVKEGTCIIQSMHTTAGLTVNENADPSVQRDMLMQLAKLAPEGAGYSHSEGNSDSHIKTSLVGPSLNIIISGGKLLLGTWQGIYFCEFDGPRSRKVAVQIIGSE